MKTGIYKTCRLVIAKYINSGRSVINIDDCLNEVLAVADFSEMTEDEKDEMISRFALTNVLNSHNFYSVVRRKGFFANIDDCKKAYLKAIINNAKNDVVRYEALLDKLNKRLDVAEIDGQMEFDFDSNEIIEQVTADDLLRMLREEASSGELVDDMEEEKKRSDSSSTGENQA